MIQPPALSWNEDGLPIADAFDDPYFSVDNGLEETRYVFLQHNGLPQRWAEGSGPFRIIETGFGTGLNFLATWQSFRETAAPERWLHFTSIEKFPLTTEQLQRALALWPQLEELSSQLIARYPPAAPGFHVLTWPEERVTLTLIFADVHDALPELNGPVDAWYLDGFAPAKNPAMWSDALFAEIRRISRNPRPGREPTVATFTSAGLVRRGLRGAGFDAKKCKGFGRKREMLAGAYTALTGPESPYSQLPWQTTPAPLPYGSTVVIAGAGLAGCTTARALAERGFRVIVCDPAGIAQGASGNPQGGLYIKLAADDQATHSDFYRQAYLLALQEVRRILGPDSRGLHWDDCGVVQLAWDEKEVSRQQRFLERHTLPDALITECHHNGQAALRYPAAGWVSPGDYCRALLQHPAIRFSNSEISAINGSQGNLTVTTGDRSENAAAVVIASAYQAGELLKAYLPVKKIRGQLSYLNSNNLPVPDQVLCARSYMAPPLNGRLCLGATYNLKDDETALRDTDHQTNLSHLGDFGPQWQDAAQRAEITGGRVGFRCTTPDYLPMAGPVSDTDEFVARFQPMTRNAKQIPKVGMPWLSGIWVNIGHGSRGLASTPLCAQLIAAQLAGDAHCASQTVADALSPDRFLLRDLIRNRLKTD